MCRRLSCESPSPPCCAVAFFCGGLFRLDERSLFFLFSVFRGGCASPSTLPFLYPLFPPCRHIASTRRHFLFFPNPSTYTSLFLLCYGTHSFRCETPPLSNLRHPSCVHAEARAPSRILFSYSYSYSYSHFPFSYHIGPPGLFHRPFSFFVLRWCSLRFILQLLFRRTPLHPTSPNTIHPPPYSTYFSCSSRFGLHFVLSFHTCIHPRSAARWPLSPHLSISCVCGGRLSAFDVQVYFWLSVLLGRFWWWLYLDLVLHTPCWVSFVRFGSA